MRGTHIPALVWISFILLLISIPGYNIPSISWTTFFEPDKLIHFILFFVLAVLMINGGMERQQNRYFLRISMISAVVLCLLFSTMTELMQASFFRYRTADLADHFANAFGTVCGAYFFNFIKN